jgi:hypothetical protein
MHAVHDQSINQSIDGLVVFYDSFAKDVYFNQVYILPKRATCSETIPTRSPYSGSPT